jgi:hypothetical protein
MATLVNIIDGAELTRRYDKMECTRIAVVEGVSGATDAERQIDAANASGVPQINSTIGSTGLYVVEQRVKLLDGNNAHVTCMYQTRAVQPGGSLSNPNQPTYELDCVAEQITTELKPDGTPIRVGRAANASQAEDKQGASVTVTVASRTIRCTRIATGINPDLVADDVVNKINSLAWHGPPYLWKCTRYHAISNDGGTKFTETYEFQKRDPRPNTDNPFDPIAAYIDPKTGRVKDGATIANGYLAVVKWFDSFDFNLLNI